MEYDQLVALLLGNEAQGVSMTRPQLAVQLVNPP